jgi:hypothetical protein
MVDFRKEEKIHPCYLKKDDLKSLVDIIKEDFPKSDRLEDFKISTWSDSLHVSENTLDNFLAQKKLPEILTKLTIRVIGWSENRDINKSLEITFYDNYINLSISGSSETWVNGKHIQITKFLKNTRPFFWFLKLPIVSMVRGALFVFMMIGGYLIWESIFKNKSIENSIVIGTLSLFLLDWILGKIYYTKIYLTEQQSFFEKHKELITLISLIGSIAGIIGMILDHKPW